MTFKTIGNDQNNRDETKKTNLQNEIRSSWLGKRDIFQLFENGMTHENLEEDIRTIRHLLDED